jgi:putative transposase
VIRAYLFALDPTPGQQRAMRAHCGATRFAYNWSLARVKANWEQRAAEESYGVPESQRTPWINTSAYGLRRDFNAAKHEVAPWWAENSKEAYATGCANLATALANRKAGRARMPRFKSKRRARLSCRFLAALAADTAQLVREKPDRTGVRPAQRAAVAVGSLREESCETQRHHREAMAR